MALLVFLKMHKDPSFREVGAAFKISAADADVMFWKAMKQLFLDDIIPQRWAFTNQSAFQYYLDLLATKTHQHPREFEIYNRLCRPGERLIVAVGDSTKFRLNKSEDPKLQRQTYNNRLHGKCCNKA